MFNGFPDSVTNGITAANVALGRLFHTKLRYGVLWQWVSQSVSQSDKQVLVKERSFNIVSFLINKGN